MTGVWNCSSSFAIQCCKQVGLRILNIKISSELHYHPPPTWLCRSHNKHYRGEKTAKTVVYILALCVSLPLCVCILLKSNVSHRVGNHVTKSVWDPEQCVSFRHAVLSWPLNVPRIASGSRFCVSTHRIIYIIGQGRLVELWCFFFHSAMTA